jgi:hypothetical protein
MRAGNREMRVILVLILQLPAQRTYHAVPLAKVATSQQTHVETCGQVVYVRHQLDGDWHITLAIGTTKVVAEIIPLIPHGSRCVDRAEADRMFREAMRALGVNGATVWTLYSGVRSWGWITWRKYRAQEQYLDNVEHQNV